MLFTISNYATKKIGLEMKGIIKALHCFFKKYDYLLKINYPFYLYLLNAFDLKRLNLAKLFLEEAEIHLLRQIIFLKSYSKTLVTANF